MAPGTYTVSLGFAEIISSLCAAGKRVFSISVNGKAAPGASSFDAFTESGGCNSAIVKSITGVQVTATSGPILISLTAITQNAFLSTIDIVADAGGDTCVSVATGGGGTGANDHAAHAVTGSYPDQSASNAPTAYIDADGNGFETVTIDGGGSHTHYADSSVDPPIVGDVISTKWYDATTGVLLSDKVSFTKDFPLGTTRLLLKIVDNICTTDESETTVTVVGSTTPGSYCYYYEMGTPLTGIDLLTSSSKPKFAVKVDSFVNPLPAPPGFASSEYIVRCQFFYQVDADSEATKFAISTGGSGEAKLYKEADVLLSTMMLSETTTSTAVGLTAFEVQFTSTSMGNPTITLTVNGTALPANKLSFDVKTVLPIITSISPSDSAPAGGGQAAISGYGFFLAPQVKFGSAAAVTGSSTGISPTQFTVTVPASSQEGVVPVTVSTPQSGTSNSIPFTYAGGTENVAFTKKSLQEASGALAKSGNAAAIAVWGDSWYLGSRFGFVTKLEVDTDLKVTGRCQTGTFPDNEWTKAGQPSATGILGIAFSPTDNIGEPYITVSTFFWFFDNQVDEPNPTAWRNGRIDRLTPGGSCLVKKERVVSYLPVSDHDHSVNSVQFLQNGDMLVRFFVIISHLLCLHVRLVSDFG
jgi:Malectin domain/IPT/TIG domain